MSLNFDPTKKYRLIPEVLDVECPCMVYDVLCSPFMAKFLEEKITRAPVDWNEMVRCGRRHRYIGEYLNCYACLGYGLFYISANEGLSGETLKKLPSPHKYANPIIWDSIKDDKKLLNNLSEEDMYHLLYNPYGISYMEARIPELKDKDRVKSAIFYNPSANDFVIAQGYSKQTMFEYGSREGRFFKYFDMEYCEKVLTGKIDRGVGAAIDLIYNIEAKELVRKHVRTIMEIYDGYLGRYITTYSELIDIVLENIDLFQSYGSLTGLNHNQNPAAIEYLENNPDKIIHTELAINKKATHIIIPYLETLMETKHYFLDRDLRNRLSRNSAMVPFLRRHPEFMTHYIFCNRNIFEGDI